MDEPPSCALAIVRGVPLSEEPGLGPLTLPGFLREVTRRHADREALVFHYPDGRAERWSYAELWACDDRCSACEIWKAGCVRG